MEKTLGAGAEYCKAKQALTRYREQNLGFCTGPTSISAHALPTANVTCSGGARSTPSVADGILRLITELRMRDQHAGTKPCWNSEDAGRINAKGVAGSWATGCRKGTWQAWARARTRQASESFAT